DTGKKDNSLLSFSKFHSKLDYSLTNPNDMKVRHEGVLQFADTMYIDSNFNFAVDVPVNYEYGVDRRKGDMWTPIMQLQLENRAKPVQFSARWRLNDFNPGKHQMISVDSDFTLDYHNFVTE